MRYPFADNKPLQGLTIATVIVMVMLVGLFLASLIVKYTLPMIFGITDAQGFMYSQTDQLKNPMATLYVQSLTSSIGFFLFPAIAFHLLFSFNIIERTGLNILPPLKYWLVAIVTMLAAGIFIQLLVQLSQMIPLPEKLQSLRTVGKFIDELLESFFTRRSPQYFLVLTLVMALLPAISEEAFFRGTIQNIFLDFRCTPLAAVILSGLFFATMHMEFDNLLAIWCMGIVLGLLYYYTGSLWVSIMAHFFNNFAVVAGKYAYTSGATKSEIFSSDTLPIYYTIPAGVIMVGGLVVLAKWSGKKVNSIPI